MTLSRAQWETVLDEASPPTFGEFTSVLEERTDLLDESPVDVLEAAIANGTLVDGDDLFGELELIGEAADTSDESPGVETQLDLDLTGTEPDTLPEDLVANGGRWLPWQYTGDRKILRNPRWGTDSDHGWAKAGTKDPRAWFSADDARRWTEHDLDLGLGYYLITPDLSDWTDTRKEKYDVHATQVDDGRHFGLIDIATDEWPDAEIEICEGDRYTTITGDHIPGSALKVSDVQDIVGKEYGTQFRTAITTAQVEAGLEERIDEASCYKPSLMHFGEEKARNDFAHESVGLVNGCMDLGDDFVLNTLAKLNLDDKVETVDAVDCSKEHIRTTLERLAESDDEQSPVQMIDGAGAHGATL